MPLIPASVPPSGAHERGLPGTATMTTPSGVTLALASSHDDPVDVFVAPGAGGLTFQLATVGAGHSLFNISGDAATGRPVRNDRISLLGPDALYLDTTQPGTVRCTTSYSAATAHSIVGTATCTLLPDSEQSGTVVVRFTVGH